MFFSPSVSSVRIKKGVEMCLKQYHFRLRAREQLFGSNELIHVTRKTVYNLEHATASITLSTDTHEEPPVY